MSPRRLPRATPSASSNTLLTQGAPNIPGSTVLAYAGAVLAAPIDNAGWRREPQAYLVTFSCYGTHLHGDERGSVDRRHNVPHTPYLEPQRGRAVVARVVMKSPPYALDSDRRGVTLRALCETCNYRGWGLLAAHVRSNHVHAVVATQADRAAVLRDLKAYASRALNKRFPEDQQLKKWTRHGSAPRLWGNAEVVRSVNYVLHGQGERMAVYSPEEFRPPSEPPA